MISHALARSIPALPGLIHLAWRSADNRTVDVYVDGEWYDRTADPTQRELWLTLDPATPHRVELDGWTPQPRDTLTLEVVRDERLPLETQVTLRVDGSTTLTQPLWDVGDARGGFGAIFGSGGFGMDAATGPGLGRGELGQGPLGADGTAWRHTLTDLSPGDHTVTITAHDAAGRELVTEAVELAVTTDRLPPQASRLRVQPDLTLTWSL